MRVRALCAGLGERLGGFGGGVPAKARGPLPGGAAQGVAARLVLHEGDDGAGEGGGIAGGDEEAGLTVAHALAQAGHIAGDGGDAAGAGFEHGAAPAFLGGGLGEQGGALKEPAFGLFGDGAEETYAVGAEAERGGERFETRGVDAVAGEVEGGGGDVAEHFGEGA